MHLKAVWHPPTEGGRGGRGGRGEEWCTILINKNIWSEGIRVVIVGLLY